MSCLFLASSSPRLVLPFDSVSELTVRGFPGCAEPASAQFFEAAKLENHDLDAKLVSAPRGR